MPGQFSTSRYVVDNVIPAVLKVTARSIGEGVYFPSSYDPDSVVLHDASGGFNSVVEVAGEYCLRMFNNQVDLPGVVVRIPPSQLQEFIESQEKRFDADYLNDLEIDVTSEYQFALGVELIAKEIEFLAPHKVCVKFKGDMWLMQEIADVEIDPSIIEKIENQFLPLGTPVELESPSIGPMQRRSTATPGPSAARQSLRGTSVEPPGRASARMSPRSLESDHPVMYEPSVERTPARWPRAYVYSINLTEQRIDSRFVDLHPSVDEPRQLTKLHRIGTLSLTICCNYEHEAYFELKRVDIYADLATHERTFDVPKGDTRVFYNEFLKDKEGTFTQPIGKTSRIYLTPTISLAGRNPSKTNITELPEFEVRVFHVGARPNQALAAAFDLMPGCKGIIEDVQHFIGDRDYGVISDEYLVERICKHKWRLGGFDRRITIERPIKITRDGREEDAYLHGILQFNSLDYVTIETDSNTRTDYIRLGGMSEGIPQYIRLRDGTIVGPDQVDFGNPQTTPWSLFTTLSVTPVWSPDPEVREIQLRAHLDAYRHLARPFARFPDWMYVVYTRVEGVTKFIFVLGELPSLFQ